MLFPNLHVILMLYVVRYGSSAIDFDYLFIRVETKLPNGGAASPE
jgi:hypothetical protein